MGAREHSKWSWLEEVQGICSTTTKVCFCEKGPNSDFLGQIGQNKVRIYTEKFESYHFPFILRLSNINKLP